MVLHAQVCGRVGSRPVYLPEKARSPKGSGFFAFAPGSLPGRNRAVAYGRASKPVQDGAARAATGASVRIPPMMYF